MTNIISNTGFWISNDEKEHTFIKELSDQINKYILENNIKTVYDFGCGEGKYLKSIVEFDKSIIATGFEGHQINGVFNNILKEDLSKKINMPKVDLVISIEVGEHIPKEFEQVFIDNICTHSKDHVILSWAVKNQGGLGHVNCQNNDYIISQMLERGFHFDQEKTKEVRLLMPAIWIKNTIMIFKKSIEKHL